MATLLSGLQIPPIIYGTASRPRTEPQLVEEALLLGYGGLDTACSRKLHAEDADGVALRAALSRPDGPHRSSLLIQSKFVAAGNQADPWPFKFEDSLRSQVLSSVFRSCEDLGVDFLDVYFLARPFVTFSDSLIAWKALEEVVQHGGIRYLGICHCPASILRQLCDTVTIKPRFVQLRFEVLYHDEGLIVEVCRANDIVVEMFGMFWSGAERFLCLDAVAQWALECNQNKHAAFISLLLADITDKGLYAVVLDGSRRSGHMRDNIGAARLSSDVPMSLILEFRSEVALLCCT